MARIVKLVVKVSRVCFFYSSPHLVWDQMPY